MKTLVSDLAHARADGDVRLSGDLSHEVRFDVYHDDGLLFPIHVGAYLKYIIRLGSVVKLEIYRVVDVPELIHVVESDLHGHDVLKFLCFFHFLVLKSVQNYAFCKESLS